MSRMWKWMLPLCLVLLSTGFAAAQSQLERDLADLRAWMQRRSSQADSVIRQEWPSVKQEFKELTYSLDRNTKKMPAKSQEEYQGIKQQYQEWEDRNERTSVSLDGDKLAQWERKMTGTTQISRVKPVHLRDAYTRLLEYTREQRRDWSLRDWEYAEFVFGELNTRKAEVLDLLSGGDKIKIAALQVEFATLKKGREAKDAYEHMREENR